MDYEHFVGMFAEYFGVICRVAFIVSLIKTTHENERRNYMKALLVLLSLTFSVSAFASKDAKQEILQILMENANTITVVDEDNGTKEKNLVALLSEALSAGEQLEKTAIIMTVYGECEDTTPKGLLGSSKKKCRLTVGDGDYKVTKNGLEGPSAESGITFTFEVTQVVAPNSKPEVSVVYVSRAG